MGKVLLEKLLRSCPEINHIYVLTRTKRGQCPQDRMTNLLEGPLYTALAENSPDVLKKISAIAGDVTEPNLGISPSDEEMIINNVSVIFHVAATVKFDDVMSNAIKMNVKGTYSIIDLARKIKKEGSLSSLVHVSTAYSHCYSSSIMEEKFYPMPKSRWNSSSPDELIELFEQAKAEGRDNTKDILGIFPNTYIFTKAWAEKVVQENATDLPVVIMRPSIVVASVKEPIPGWVDNLNGPTGIIAAAGVGLMQTIYAKRDKKADLIPVDISCNLLCALAWKVGTETPSDIQKPREIQIYNNTSGSTVPVKWGEVEKAMGYLLKYPLENMLWYPYGCTKSLWMSPMKNHKIQDRVCRVLFHWFPAYFIDTVSYIARIKSTSRIKLVNRMEKAMHVLEYFSTREWDWDTKNVESLHTEISLGDQSRYNFSLKNLKWEDYFESTMQGTRQFAMKSDPKTIEACRKRLTKFYVAHQVMKLIYWFMFYLLVSRIWAHVFPQ